MGYSSKPLIWYVGSNFTCLCKEKEDINPTKNKGGEGKRISCKT